MSIYNITENLSKHTFNFGSRYKLQILPITTKAIIYAFELYNLHESQTQTAYNDSKSKIHEYPVTLPGLITSYTWVCESR